MRINKNQYEINEEDKKSLGLKCLDIDGTSRAYTDKDSKGAPLRRGARIEKTMAEDYDYTPVGASGTIIGSLGPMHFDGKQAYLYFIAWDMQPLLPVACIDTKIAPKKLVG